MKIMVIGSGGREHAIIRKLRENPRVERVWALPGNGGIAADAECVAIAATDVAGVVAFAAENKADLVVVTPDDPLALGMVDALHTRGIACFGPNQAAARIESSKIFAKALMRKHGIPTARYEAFADRDAALAYIDAQPEGGVVVKADGLALGKGVVVAETRAAAREAVRRMMDDRAFGESGARVVIEERLQGPEVSVLTFTDGHTVRPMPSSMDHKRALAGDRGANTGGMGAIAPNPFYTDAVAERCMREIFLPTIAAMRAEGCPFKGCLYFGLMLTADGPKVIEYNCRFGDPETQAVLPLMDSDLLDAMLAVENETLADADLRFAGENTACACVMAVSGGYPAAYEKGKRITILPAAAGDAEVAYLHSGTRLGGGGANGAYFTAGGRVLGAVCRAFASTPRDALRAAIEGARAGAARIQFENVYVRPDIGDKALEVLA